VRAFAVGCWGRFTCWCARLRTGRAGAHVLVLVAALAGCAWNDHGLVRVERLENDTARLVRLDAWGAHLVTGSPDGGLTLGHSQREYLYPREDAPPGAAVTFDAAQVMDEAAARLTPAATAAAPSPSGGPPVVTIVRTGGVSFDLSATRIGLHLGVRSRAMLSIARDADVLVHVRFDSETRSAYLQGRWQ
jgi:hypothetical protein